VRSRHLLVVISTAQLGVTGQLVAVREGRSFEIFRWHGNPEDVVRDSWFIGTGLSAPVSMLAVQVAAIAILARRASRPAAAALAGLGLMMVVGSLLENKIRSAIRDAGADRVVTVIAGLGLALAVGMVVVGVPTARSAGSRER
jgi:hypothetical protein